MMSEADWRAELAVLLSDLVDENGTVARTDSDSEAGQAWAKIHALYPDITLRGEYGKSIVRRLPCPCSRC